MAFTPLTADLTVIEQLADTPNRTSGYTAQQIKEFFDQNAKTIQDYINNTFLAEIGGANGAPNIGIFPSETFTNVETVQQALEYLYQQIQDATISGVVDNSITDAKLKKDSGFEAVTSETIRNGAITTEKILNLAVTAAKIADLTITAAKIANGTITSGKIGNKEIKSANIDDGAVGTDKLANGAVTTDKLAANSVDLTAKVKNSLPVANGGTGAADAAGARANLGITPANIGVTAEGKLKIGNTEYTLRKGGTPAAGYITFIV